MRRREFIAGLSGAAAATWPLAARAQQAGKLWRIGFLSGAARPVSLESSQWGGFLQGMRELGYVAGKDFVIEWRFAEGRSELFPGLAAELVSEKVDIVVVGNAAVVRPVQQASSTIPIVMAVSIDPVGAGIVTSLARPGGNITGLATSADDTAPKQLELLAMAVPNLSRVGFLSNPDSPSSSPFLKSVQVAAPTAGLKVLPVEARNPPDLESAFATLIKERAEAVMVMATDGFLSAQRRRIADLAIRNLLPTIFPQAEYVEAGGLMSYGESARDFNRRAAAYVDKIIKGAKPADLPIQQPTRFFLVINRKTADAIGLTIPLQLLVRADEVIE
jgi:putative tryptophan/tyrosine transport system substrate-binding protein